MRQITITRTGARSASGRLLHPEYKVWLAREDGTTIAFADEKKTLEQLFPHAHSDYDHHYNFGRGCFHKGCWMNPDTKKEERHAG